jgi:predicted permease
VSVALDVRASVRYFRRRPLLIWLAVGTLGVGLGVASALFGVIRALYLRPLPLDEEKRVVVVRGVQAEQGLTDEAVSRHDMADLLADSKSVAAFGGLRNWNPALFVNDRAEPIVGIAATPDTFDVFAVRPHLGRLFTAADDVPGRNRVVVLAYGAWLRRFGGDRNVVGRALSLGRESFTIIGVLPERLSAPRFADAELWVPLSVDPDYQRGRGHRNLTVYARLAPQASRAAFGAELLARSQALAARYPETNVGWTERAIPLIDYELGSVLPRLLLLGAAAALLLLMACANIGSLMFAESMARSSEYGLRAALGGSAGHLFRQLFADHLVLCLTGGASAVAIGWTLLALTGRFAAAIPRAAEIRPDGSVVVFAFAVSVVLASSFAAISVFHALRDEPAVHIRNAERSVTHSVPRWVSHALVVSQVALAFVLLWSGISFARAYRRVATASPGFDTRGLLLLRVQTVEKMKRKALVSRSVSALDDLPLMPGIVSATIASSGPLFGDREETEVATESMTAPLTGRYANVDAGFFDALRIPLIAGRRFTRGDDGRGAPVVILSRSLAGRLFPRGDAVGKDLLLGSGHVRHRVAGIVGDADESRVAQGGIEMYVPFTQDPRGAYFLVVRGARGEAPPPAAVTERLRHSLPGFMVLKSATLDETITGHLFAPRLQMLLLILFAAGAAILAAVAVFGMVTLAASSRAGEIGLRLALGSTPRQAQALLLRGIAGPVTIAVAAGAAIIPAAISRLQPLLGAIRYADPLTAAIAAASVIAALTIVASWQRVQSLAQREPVETLSR